MIGPSLQRLAPELLSKSSITDAAAALPVSGRHGGDPYALSFDKPTNGRNGFRVVGSVKASKSRPHMRLMAVQRHFNDGDSQIVERRRRANELAHCAQGDLRPCHGKRTRRLGACVVLN